MMQEHTPTILDAATDLQRAAYAAYYTQSLDDQTVVRFINHAKDILSATSDSLSNWMQKVIKERLAKVQQKKVSPQYGAEDLLLAATLLQSQFTAKSML